jgi:hypothetical protein
VAGVNYPVTTFILTAIGLFLVYLWREQRLTEVLAAVSGQEGSQPWTIPGDVDELLKRGQIVPRPPKGEGGVFDYDPDKLFPTAPR